MKEAEYWNNIAKAKFAREGGHCCRIENVIGNGMPDVEWCIGGKTIKVETKVAKTGYLYFEKFQIPWMVRRRRHGGEVWVLVYDKPYSKLYSADTIIAAPKEPYKKWTRVKMLDLSLTAAAQGRNGWPEMLSHMTN